MKAVFMEERNGLLIELFQEDIKPTLVYRRALKRPFSAPMPKFEEETWEAVCRPLHADGFAVFMKRN